VTASKGVEGTSTVAGWGLQVGSSARQLVREELPPQAMPASPHDPHHSGQTVAHGRPRTTGSCQPALHCDIK
jgi:hypothetical protein